MSMRVHASLVVCLLLLAVPSWSQLGGMGSQWASGTGPPPEKPFLVGIGPVTVEADDEVSGVCAIGPVSIAGKVYGDVTSIGGKVTIGPGAVVAGNVTGVSADVEVADGAKVAGDVQANQLPEMAEVRLGSTPEPKARLFIGGAELTDDGVRDALVLGGEVLVQAGATVRSLTVVGANVMVMPGADVHTARAIGGTVTREDGDEKQARADKVVEARVLRCSGATPQEGSAAVWNSPRVDFSDQQGTRLSMAASGTHQANASIAVRTQLAADLGLSVRVAQRRPESERPKARDGEQPTRGGGGGYGGGFEPPWPGEALYISTDADPLFQRSTALGVGLKMTIRVSFPGTPSGNSSDEQSITIAVPADAARPDMVHGFGGGFGGGLGGFGQY